MQLNLLKNVEFTFNEVKYLVSQKCWVKLRIFGTPCTFLASFDNSMMLNVTLASLFDSLMSLCPQVGGRWQYDALALMEELLLKRSVKIELKV